MANAEAVLADITDLEGNYLARTETPVLIASIFPILECSSGQQSAKSFFTSESDKTPRFAGLPEKVMRPSAGFAGINSFIAAQRRATVPTDITLLIVLAFSSFSSLSQRENEPRSDLWIL